MLSKIDQAKAEMFERMIHEAGLELTAENVLKCIGFAKQAMLSGEVSVEAYYKAKEILLTKVEVASELLN